MPDDSNGIYSVPAGTIVSTGDTILPSQHNPWANDSASAISNRFSKDGRAPATGNWNLNGFRMANVGSPVASGDAVNKTYADGNFISVNSQSLTPTQQGRAWANIGGSRENDDLIINGAFDVAQRGASFTLNAGSNYTLDRWIVGPGSGGVCAVIQGQHAVSGQYSDFYMRINQTVGGVFPFFSQKIENVRSYAGQTITVFLRASCAVTLPVQVIVRQFFGTGGSPSALVDTVVGTLNVGAIGWHSINVDVPDIIGKLLGTNNNDCFEVIFRLPDGTIFELNVVNVFIKRGVVPVEAANYYSPPPIWETEPACMRYFQRVVDIINSAGQQFQKGHYPIPMRRTPDLSIVSGSISPATLNSRTNKLYSFDGLGALNEAVTFNADAEL